MVDEITPAGMPGLGLIEAKTTNFGGHPPEFWAERLTEKIVSSSDSSDPHICLLYTSPSPRDQRGSRMPSSA